MTDQEKKQYLAEIDEVVQKAVDGEYKLYPVLQPASWPGVKNGALYNVEVSEDDNKDVPLVIKSYAVETPDGLVYLSKKHKEFFGNRNLYQEASDNLDELEQEFNFEKEFDNKVLSSNGTRFSNERALSYTQMRMAHDFLESEELFVSIPRRGNILIIPKDSDKELLDMFLHVHRHNWNDTTYNNAHIANILLYIKSGNREGIVYL
ncbi:MULTISPECIES: hypothetical protein [Polaribacter]|uniref:DUF1444 family protein n=1 Tax=Polaribacter sejongensis TaxID=985043 RepID=A0AAJ1QXW0_9FLAO|nr:MULTISPECIES: hypothetical protein [Polaribacter]AUC23526.1 hypothetical protein BTO15_16095 [Polaribacter sejongensis]MDN3619621.1 hypothetical protein [Polaribacter undariae]UWD32265.1 hypothetical protein NQP51_01045 [Polaribacter undariae]